MDTPDPRDAEIDDLKHELTAARAALASTRSNLAAMTERAEAAEAKLAHGKHPRRS